MFYFFSFGKLYDYSTQKHSQNTSNLRANYYGHTEYHPENFTLSLKIAHNYCTTQLLRLEVKFSFLTQRLTADQLEGFTQKQ